MNLWLMQENVFIAILAVINLFFLVLFYEDLRDDKSLSFRISLSWFPQLHSEESRNLICNKLVQICAFNLYFKLVNVTYLNLCNNCCTLVYFWCWLMPNQWHCYYGSRYLLNQPQLLFWTDHFMRPHKWDENKFRHITD